MEKVALEAYHATICKTLTKTCDARVRELKPRLSNNLEGGEELPGVGGRFQRRDICVPVANSC